MNMLVSTAAISTAAIAIPAPDDHRLIELEEMIMAEHEKATAHDDELHRLHEIWSLEYRRLSAGMYIVAAAERRQPTDDERDAISQKISDMPECAEHTRLNDLTRPHWDCIDVLTKEMWPIPAHTSQGRKAKLNVLLNTVMGSREWLETDKDSDYDIRLFRQLLLEFAGEEAAAPWKEHFASDETDRKEVEAA